MSASRIDIKDNAGVVVVTRRRGSKHGPAVKVASKVTNRAGVRQAVNELLKDTVLANNNQE